MKDIKSKLIVIGLGVVWLVILVGGVVVGFQLQQGVSPDDSSASVQLTTTGTAATVTTNGQATSTTTGSTVRNTSTTSTTASPARDTPTTSSSVRNTPTTSTSTTTTTGIPPRDTPTTTTSSSVRSTQPIATTRSTVRNTLTTTTSSQASSTNGAVVVTARSTPPPVVSTSATTNTYQCVCPARNGVPSVDIGLRQDAATCNNLCSNLGIYDGVLTNCAPIEEGTSRNNNGVTETCRSGHWLKPGEALPPVRCTCGSYDGLQPNLTACRNLCINVEARSDCTRAEVGRTRVSATGGTEFCTGEVWVNKPSITVAVSTPVKQQPVVIPEYNKPAAVVVKPATPSSARSTQANIPPKTTTSSTVRSVQPVVTARSTQPTTTTKSPRNIQPTTTVTKGPLRTDYPRHTPRSTEVISPGGCNGIGGMCQSYSNTCSEGFQNSGSCTGGGVCCTPMYEDPNDSICQMTGAGDCRSSCPSGTVANSYSCTSSSLVCCLADPSQYAPAEASWCAALYNAYDPGTFNWIGSICVKYVKKDVNDCSNSVYVPTKVDSSYCGG